MPAPIDHAEFRGALGRFASGVTVVTTLVEGAAHAMTASAFSSVSLDPPLVLVCTHKVNRIHDAIASSGVWGVSILNEDGRDAASWFARRGRRLDGQFDDFPYKTGVTGVPLLGEALAWLECRTTDLHDAGDHTIMVGEVVSARCADNRDDPLLYYRSHFGKLIHTNRTEKGIDE